MGYWGELVLMGCWGELVLMGYWGELVLMGYWGAAGRDTTNRDSFGIHDCVLDGPTY